MKTSIKLLMLLAAVLLAGNSARAKHYAKAIVELKNLEGAEGAGVYATSDLNKIPQASDFSTKSTAKGSADGKDIKFNLFAPIVENYKITWKDSDGNIIPGDVTGNISKATVTINSWTVTELTAITEHYTAEYTFVPMVTVENGGEYGVVTIDKKNNLRGDVITISASWLNEQISSDCPKDVDFNLHPNKAIKFNGWTKEDGTLFSMEPSLTFTVEEPMKLTANIEFRRNVDKEKGYYRIRSIYDSPLKLVGKNKIEATSVDWSDVSMDADMCWLRNPEGYGYGYDNVGNYYEDPGTIMFIEAGKKGSNFGNFKKRNTVLPLIKMSCQGVDIYGLITQDGLNYYRNMDIKWSDMPGYYRLASSDITFVKNLMFRTDSEIYPGGESVNFWKKDYSAATMFYLEPVDASHADEYWFGVFPHELMELNGGYWASMYTAFPYKCLEKDGVEAYFVKEVVEGEKENIAILSKIENGIVPANTAVLLKCKDLIDTDEYFNGDHGDTNRFDHPVAKPVPANRLIPLMPDDPTIDNNVAAGNLLKGEFQLHTNVPTSTSTPAENGHVIFDPAKHLVFSASIWGAVGFYKLPEGTALGANKAYLDMENIHLTNPRAPMRVAFEGENSGVENVEVDRPAAIDGNDVIFDLQGRRVTLMVPGTIYILNGHKYLCK